MDKIWTKSYDPDVPHTIDPDQYASVPDMLVEAFQKYSDRPCFMNFGTSLTFKQIDELSQAYAGFLQTECNLKKGDRVAIMMPNTLQFPVALFGALRAGMINVNISPLYDVDQVHYALKHTEAKCVLVLANFAHILQEALAGTQVKHVIVTEIGDLFPLPKRLLFNFITKTIKKMIPAWYIPNTLSLRETINIAYQKKFTKPSLVGDDIAYLQFTEGRETGTFKCAVLTHRNFVANGVQTIAWLHSFFKTSSTGGMALAMLPFFKLIGLSTHCLTFMQQGFTNNLITNPRETALMIQEIKKHPPSLITSVRTIFNDLLFNADFQKINFSSLKHVFVGGMKIPQALADRWESWTGTILSTGYVLTEGSPTVMLNPLSLKTFNGALGLPLPSTEAKICDEQGQELPIGSRGEIWIKGPQVCRSYWNQPEETQKVFTEDGWFKTGDMGYMTIDGYFYFLDRKEDTIKIGQNVVYPSEVEDIITEMGGIEEAIIVSALSVRQELFIKAFIVKSDPSLSEETILAHCRRRLHNYQIPNIIEFCEKLPRSATGFILRRQLREGDKANHE